MQRDLIELAEAIANGIQNTVANNAVFSKIICDLTKLNECLNALNYSQTFIFIYSNSMINLIQNRQFYPIPFKDQSQILFNDRCMVFGQIVMSIANHLHRFDNNHLLTESMISLIGIHPNQHKFLQQIIQYFIPHYQLDSDISNHNMIAYFPRRELDLNNMVNYQRLIRIFISMLNYISSSCCSSDIYKHRNNLSTFKSQYLAYLLKFSVEHLKFLLSAGQNFRPQIILTLQLLQKIFTYSFAFVISSNIEDVGGSIIEQYTSCSINFPGYFLHVICDQQFINSLLQYFHYVLGSTANYHFSKVEIISLLKIIGRLNCPSSFIFKNDQQKLTVLRRSFIIIQNIISNFKFLNQEYLLLILDNLYNFFAMDDPFIRQNKVHLIFKIINFFKIIVFSSQIVISQGKDSPLSRIMQILSKQEFYQGLKNSNQYLNYAVQCQLMLECIYNRILNNYQAKVIFSKYNFQSCSEIQDFSQLFSSISKIFLMNTSKNIEYLQLLDISQLDLEPKIILFHVCSQILRQMQTIQKKQVGFILKYYALSLNIKSLASLRLIKVLTQKIMVDMNGGIPKSQIWKLLVQNTNLRFQQFIKNTINLCFDNFNSKNNQIFEYSLQFFKLVYSNLKKKGGINLSEYSQLVNQMLDQFTYNSILAGIQNLQKRRRFYNIISIVQIGLSSIENVYKLYQRIKNPIINSYQRQAILYYLFDLTGLIQPITIQEPFQAIVNLCLDDLTVIFRSSTENEITQAQYFNDPIFVVIISKLINCLTQNLQNKLNFENHNILPSNIYSVIYPYVQILTTIKMYIPNDLIPILINMVKLNPLERLIDFSSLIPKMKQQNFPRLSQLIKIYFINIRRVQSIGWMYGLIESNVDFMAQWWQETIFREEHPDINLRNIYQSKFWKKKSQKKKFVKMIYQIAFYDPTYWNIEQFPTMEQFLSSFGIRQHTNTNYENIFNIENDQSDQDPIDQ